MRQDIETQIDPCLGSASRGSNQRKPNMRIFMKRQGETMAVMRLVSEEWSPKGIWKLHRGCGPGVIEQMHGGYRILTSRSKCTCKKGDVYACVCVCALICKHWGEVDCGEKLGKDFQSFIIRIMTGKTKHRFEICLCV